MTVRKIGTVAHPLYIHVTLSGEYRCFRALYHMTPANSITVECPPSQESLDRAFQ